MNNDDAERSRVARVVLYHGSGRRQWRVHRQRTADQASDHLFAAAYAGRCRLGVVS